MANKWQALEVSWYSMPMEELIEEYVDICIDSINVSSDMEEQSRCKRVIMERYLNQTRKII